MIKVMTEIIITFVCINTLLLILIGNSVYKQNEGLRQEIKELKIMLKDRTVHITHKIRE